MAISGSIDFTLTRDTCIKEALQQLGAIGAGEDPTAEDYTDCALTMNLMLKSWQNRDVARNLIRPFYVFLEPNKRVYDLSTTVAASAPSGYSFWADTLAADYTDDDLTMTVTDGTGAADADELVLVADNGALLVGDVESGGGTTTLTVPDLNGDAESGKYYYTFNGRAQRPISILYANRCLLPVNSALNDELDYNSHPVTILTRRDYSTLAAKSTDGASTSIFYDAQWPTGKLYVWPESANGGEFLEIWGQFQIDDMDSDTDNFALPSRWYYAVTMNLAKCLLTKYGTSADTRAFIKEEAKTSLLDAEFGETEDYVQFIPDNRRR